MRTLRNSADVLAQKEDVRKFAIYDFFGPRFAPESIWSLCYFKKLSMGTLILHDLTELWKDYMKLDHARFSLAQLVEPPQWDSQPSQTL